MISILCPREAALLAAQRSPTGLDDEGRRHLTACPSCAAALAAERALAPFAGRPLPSPLPPASTVLVRARLAARRRALERSVAPLALWRGLVLAVAVAASFFLGLPGLLGGVSVGADTAPPSAAQTIAGLGLLLIAALPFLGRLRPGDS